MAISSWLRSRLCICFSYRISQLLAMLTYSVRPTAVCCSISSWMSSTLKPMTWPMDLFFSSFLRKDHSIFSCSSEDSPTNSPTPTSLVPSSSVPLLTRSTTFDFCFCLKMTWPGRVYLSSTQ